MLSGFARSTIESARGCDESPVEECAETGGGEDNGKPERVPAAVGAAGEPAGDEEPETGREKKER
jgi:hypothetical protein